jgi:hypothetical protein
VADGDWRLMGQQSWLVGRALRFGQWTSPRPGWDHDHCAFCYAEIAATKSDHIDFIAGYVTIEDNYTWICPPCFEDFKTEFHWTVAPTTAGP